MAQRSQGDNPTAREAMAELQRMVHRVCALILNPDYPEVDILIEREKVRQRCQELFPDRMDLYEMVYDSRFDRLMQQFRKD
jgi:hypothetical protein